MGDSKWRRGGKNPHVRTTRKQPCKKCGNLADHYSDGTISRHKVYVYKEVKGVLKKTTSWSYCPQKTWN